MRRVDSLEKTLMLGRIGGRRKRGRQRWDGWMASRTQWTWVWVNSGRWWWIGRPGVLRFMGLQRVGHDWATELNWTVYNYTKQTKSGDGQLHCGISIHNALYWNKLFRRHIHGTVVKNPLASAEDTGDTGSIPGSGKCPGVGNGNPLQYYNLENSMNRGA